MSDEMIIGGYAIVFNQKTLLYEYDGRKYYEIIDPKALRGVDLSDVVLRYNHNDNVMIMAGTKNKSLELTVDGTGLMFKAKLANTTAGRDLYEMTQSGLTNKMSFAFHRAEDKIDLEGRDRIVTITKFSKIIEISCVDFPAYKGTSCYTINPEIENLKRQIREKSELEEMKSEMRRKEKERNQVEVLRLRAEILSKC